MNRIVILLMVPLILGCASSGGYMGTDDVPPVQIAKRLQHAGFSIGRPPFFGWRLKISDQTQTKALFRRELSSRTHSALVSVELLTLPRNPTSQEDFASLVREDKIYDTNRFERLSYDQQLATMQGQWATQYRWSIRDSKAPNSPNAPVIMRDVGYVILHPSISNAAVRVRFSERGLERELDDRMETEGRKIMDSVRLDPIR